MATAVAPAVAFGQALFTGLVQAGTLGPGAAITQAVLSPISVYFALVLLLNGAGEWVAACMMPARHLRAPERTAFATCARNAIISRSCRSCTHPGRHPAASGARVAAERRPGWH